MSSSNTSSDRRKFLSFLAASPVLALGGFTSSWVEDLLAEPLAAESQESFAAQNNIIIKSVKEALNVFDFDMAARQKLSPAHYQFLTVGTFNGETLRANREGFTKYQIRMRQLTGIEKSDQSIQLFGVKWDSPIFLCPLGRMTGFHPEGNLAVARAAKAKRTLEIMSMSTQDSIEDVNAARGEPIWFQLYAGSDWKLTEAVLKRVEAAGCPAVAWTIDGVPGSNQSNALAIQSVGVPDRDRTADTRCSGCHSRPMPRPNEAGLGSPTGAPRPAFTWNDVKRVKGMMRMKLLLKGISTGADAALAVQHGADGVIVSNHGGHVDAGGLGSIDCLAEVVAGAAGKIPVLIDSGFRSGADVYKALALGATAVGVGRPYVWGLASFGQEGVETVIEILRRELQMVMAQTGAASVAGIRRDSLVSRRLIA